MDDARGGGPSRSPSQQRRPLVGGEWRRPLQRRRALPNGGQRRRKPGAARQRSGESSPTCTTIRVCSISTGRCRLAGSLGPLLRSRCCRVADPSSRRLEFARGRLKKPVRDCIAGGRMHGSPFSSPRPCRAMRPFEEGAKAEGILPRCTFVGFRLH
jgi:hypothetical protein